MWGVEVVAVLCALVECASVCYCDVCAGKFRGERSLQVRERSAGGGGRGEGDVDARAVFRVDPIHFLPVECGQGVSGYPGVEGVCGGKEACIVPNDELAGFAGVYGVAGSV